MKRKRVVVLGATGSIGESALKVAHDIPERMEIVGLAAKSNAQKLAAAANEVRPESVCLVDETQIDGLRKALDYEPRIFSGESGLLEIACLTNADMVLVAIVGTGGLRPALAAIKSDRTGEIQLTNGLRELRKTRPIYACEVKGVRHDTGNKLGFLKAVVYFALRRPDLAEKFSAYLTSLNLETPVGKR